MDLKEVSNDSDTELECTKVVIFTDDHLKHGVQSNWYDSLKQEQNYCFGSSNRVDYESNDTSEATPRYNSRIRRIPTAAVAPELNAYVDQSGSQGMQQICMDYIYGLIHKSLLWTFIDVHKRNSAIETSTSNVLSRNNAASGTVGLLLILSLSPHMQFISQICFPM